MISKHTIHYKDGTQKTNVRIVEGYRPWPGKAPKQRQIKNLGYAEDYEDQEAFWKMVNEEEKKFRATKEKIEAPIAIASCNSLQRIYSRIEIMLDSVSALLIDSEPSFPSVLIDAATASAACP